MSLAVWLPLNGDLHNQGLDPAIFSKTTENVWGSGKIGEKALLTSTGTKKTMVNSLKNKQKFSIAFWVKVDTTLNFTYYQDIWALEYTNSTGTGSIRFEHTSTAGNCQLIVYKETNVGENTNTYYSVKGAQNYSDNWYHITLTKNQDNTKCYINGNLTNTSSNNQYEASLGKLTGNVTIGASTCAAYLNDVRIYDHCLSPKEVEEIAKGLILHYPLNQLYDNNIIYDTSGYCNNGTIVGDITTITPSPRYNCATNFNGNNYIDSNMEINTINSTISLWMNMSNISNKHILDARNISGVGKQPIYSYADGHIETGGSSQYINSNTGLIETNKWIHLALVQNNNTLTIYKNGSHFQTLTCTNSPIIKPTICARYNHINIPVGQLSDFRIYAIALTDNQIKELYNTSMQIDSSGNVFARELVEL